MTLFNPAELPSTGVRPATISPEMIYPPRITGVTARTLALILCVTALAALFAPWVQTATGTGKVIALTPLEREQTVKAPLSGRVLRWAVQEGQAVQAGQLLLELADNDPQLVERLTREQQANQTRVEAADIAIKSIEEQLASLIELRRLTLEAADAKIRMAQNKLEASRRKLDADRAAEHTAKLQLDRQEALAAKGLTATREIEKLQLERYKASMDVATARAAVEEARAYVLSMQAERLSKGADIDAKSAKARADLQEKRAERAKYAAELIKVDTQLARQANMQVTAPRAGVVRSLMVKEGGEFVKAGDPLALLVPDAGERAIEIWVDGNDAPLVFPGRHARVQFEGWPAVQFSGWPSVAVGTFGAKVAFMDASAAKSGKLRVVLVPEDGEKWPDGQYLRQGARANGWILLNEVSLGYEVWRQLNGFPPSLDDPDAEPSSKSGAKSDDKDSKDDKAKAGE